MHFPSDLVGSLLSSGLVILVAYVVLLRRRFHQG
jgi:membrane-associated phospholipid phosphatase